MTAGASLPHPEAGAVLELFGWCRPAPRARIPPLYLTRIRSGSWLCGQAGGHVVRTWPAGRVLELPARRVGVQLAFPMVRR